MKIKYVDIIYIKLTVIEISMFPVEINNTLIYSDKLVTPIVTVQKVGYNMVFPAVKLAYWIQISLNINPVLYSFYTLV